MNSFSPKKPKMKLLYLAWAPYNRRAESFAQALGAELCFVHYFQYQKMKWAPIKYPLMAFRTLWLLWKKKPDVVFAMSPPLFCPLTVYLYQVFFRKSLIIDAHTGSLLSPPWTYFRGLHQFLCQKAVCTIVTNYTLARLVQNWGGKALVMSPPVKIPSTLISCSSSRSYITVVNSFSFDEPLAEILEAVAHFPRIEFYVTGDKTKAHPEILKNTPHNVHFTGFLPYSEYIQLLSRSVGIICMTTRDFTFQSGGEEAMALGKPFLTTDFPFLRSFFELGTIFVKPDPNSIAKGIQDMLIRQKNLTKEMRKLFQLFQYEWKLKKKELMNILQNRTENP